ncbi:MAG: hypothetical protein NVV59_10270 [Chitinophagaceae bacterium]|nr:hypothetical protein [Chitinophagaceae bacterium]
MVQVEISQLAAECNSWRDTLRGYREALANDKSKLQDAARNPLSKDQLQDVEHLQNQFHIQLINIHDLKHAIKNHQRNMDMELNVNKGQLREETLAIHENLFEQYNQQEGMLLELRGEFNCFLDSLRS